MLRRTAACAADRAAAPSRRERGKQDRRLRILDAAEALVRESGATNFTVADIARRAAMSDPTPYNLFGSKAAILFALLDRSLDPVIGSEPRTHAQRDPIARVMTAADAGVNVFVGDPAYYRPLYRFLLGVSDARQRPAFLQRSLLYWQRALSALHESGQVPLRRRSDSLARMMVLNFVAALELWVHGELDHAQFRAQVLHGTALVLLGFASEHQRTTLLRRLRRLERELPAGFDVASAA